MKFLLRKNEKFKLFSFYLSDEEFLELDRHLMDLIANYMSLNHISGKYRPDIMGVNHAPLIDQKGHLKFSITAEVAFVVT